MVRKSNKKFRFCVDFRKVNAALKPDAYPLPYMESILRKLQKARYISKLDLSRVADFGLPRAGSPKVRRTPGLVYHRVRKSTGLPDSVFIESESPPDFRTRSSSSPKVHRTSGFGFHRVRKSTFPLFFPSR